MMDRTQQHTEGYRRAAKDAVEFLEERARSMNDPHAKQVLHSAAFILGVRFSYVSKPKWQQHAGHYPGPKKMARA